MKTLRIIGCIAIAVAGLLPDTTVRAQLFYSWEDPETGLDGWTSLTAPNANNGPRDWAVSSAPGAWPGTSASEWRDGVNGISLRIVNGTQDDPHPTLWLRSPRFKLDGVSSIAAEVWLAKGGAGSTLASMTVADVPALSSDGGFRGVALRNADTGVFVATGTKSSNGDYWDQVLLDATSLDTNATYTLDLIDAGHGGWGWVTMDYVTIHGTLDASGDNTAPFMSDIEDITIPKGGNSGPLEFTIGDAETDADDLIVTASSSNTNLVPTANIVFDGSGSNRTVTITPNPTLLGSATILITVSDGELFGGDTFIVTVVPPPSTLNYNFDDGGTITDYGWTVVSTDPNQYFEITPPGPDVGETSHLTPHAGAGFVGLHCPAFDLSIPYYWDSAHTTLWIRSPEFTLDGSGDLTVWLVGGNGYGANATGKNVADVPANSFDSPGAEPFPSFLGVALRNVDTGVFALAGTKASNGGNWELVTFTAAQLAALDQNATYTLDLLDVRNGGWGWVGMDSVGIPGVLTGVPEVPSLTIALWTGNQVRLSWPASAAGYTLESSSTVNSGYADAGLTVTAEGSDNVAYAPASSNAQFYRLVKP
jgi:hypothetical protein